MVIFAEIKKQRDKSSQARERTHTERADMCTRRPRFDPHGSAADKALSCQIDRQLNVEQREANWYTKYYLLVAGVRRPGSGKDRVLGELCRVYGSWSERDRGREECGVLIQQNILGMVQVRVGYVYVDM